jgi:hypothetical protein
MRRSSHKGAPGARKSPELALWAYSNSDSYNDCCPQLVDCFDAEIDAVDEHVLVAVAVFHSHVGKLVPHDL